MHWSLYVLIGAVVNVLVNFGYKASAAKDGIYTMAAFVALVAFVTLTGLSYLLGDNVKSSIVSITKGWTPLVILGMGVGSGTVMYFFLGAMARGPISLVDPLWACVYALTSVVIGMALLKEAPSLLALSGVGLYLVGAYLMSRG